MRRVAAVIGLLAIAVPARATQFWTQDQNAGSTWRLKGLLAPASASEPATLHFVAPGAGYLKASGTDGTISALAAIPGSDVTLTATFVGFGSPTNGLTGENDFWFDSTNKSLLVGTTTNPFGAAASLHLAKNVNGFNTFVVSNANTGSSTIAQMIIGAGSNDTSSGPWLNLGTGLTAGQAGGAKSGFVIHTPGSGNNAPLVVWNNAAGSGSDVVLATGSSATSRIKVLNAGQVQIADLGTPGGHVSAAASTGQLSSSATIPYADITGAPAAITALTGDVTATGPGSVAATIANNAVTLAKMQDISTDRLLGRDTAGTGDPEQIPVSGGIEFTGGPGIQTSAFTGDATKPAGGTVMTLVNIPNEVTMAGDLLATAVSAPATPAAGKGRIYVDSTSKNLSVKDDAGVIKHGVQTAAAVSHQFVTAISDAGGVTLAQPVEGDVVNLTTDLAGKAPVGATYITQTADATLTNEQALGALATGVLSSTTTTGVVASTAIGTDLVPYGSGSILTTTSTFGFNSSNSTLAIGVAPASASATARVHAKGNNNGEVALMVENTNAGASAYGSFFFKNDAAKTGYMYFTGSGYSGGDAPANSLALWTTPTAGGVVVTPHGVQTMLWDGTGNTLLPKSGDQTIDKSGTGDLVLGASGGGNVAVTPTNTILTKAGAQLVEKRGTGDFFIGTLSNVELGFYTQNIERLDLYGDGRVRWDSVKNISLSSATFPGQATTDPTVAEWAITPPSTTSAASLGALHSWDAVTLTLSGTTHHTGTDLALAKFFAPTVTDSSAVTIDSMATVAISGAPIQAGSATITNKYALWVQGGAVRLENFWPSSGQFVFSTGPSTAPTGDGGFIWDSGIDTVTISSGDGLAHYNLGAKDSDTDYERVRAFWSSNTWTLKAEKKGGGVIRPMTIDAATATASLKGYTVALVASNSTGDSGTTSGLSLQSGSGILIQTELSGAGHLDISGPGSTSVFGSSGFTTISMSAGAGATALTWDNVRIAATSGPTVASATSAVLDAVKITGGATVSGSTAITTATGFNSVVIQSSSLTSNANITNAATLYIPGAPAIGSGSGTITNKWPIWVDDGLARFDGDGSSAIFQITPVANGTVATAMSSLGPTGSHTTIQEWLVVRNQSGTLRYIPMF